MTDLNELRFPVGPFHPKAGLSDREREECIEEMAELPARFRAAANLLDEGGLNTPYREGGWTARQVIHHVPDSHMQGYVRCKLAMSESAPVIKTYDQADWAEMEDAKTGPVEPSLALLEALHLRWVGFLRSLSEEDFARTYTHPELGEINLETTLQLYVWHGRHHLGHLSLVAGAG